MKYEFSVPGNPVGKGRPRFTRSGMVFTPKSTRDYEALVRDAFRRQFVLREPIDGPCALRISASLRIPVSATKKAKAAMMAGDVPCMVKPDADNIVKIVLDALNGCLYRDDKQVVALSVDKKYGSEPGLRVEWEVLDDGQAACNQELG